MASLLRIFPSIFFKAAYKKSPEEIVGLDFDPFLNAQDIAERYLVGKIIPKGGTSNTPLLRHYITPAVEDDWKVHQRSFHSGNRSLTVNPGSR